MNELEFCKARINSLKEDAEIMEETKRVLEDRLAQCQKRMEQGLEAEAKLAEAQVFILGDVPLYY